MRLSEEATHSSRAFRSACASYYGQAVESRKLALRRFYTVYWKLFWLLGCAFEVVGLLFFLLGFFVLKLPKLLLFAESFFNRLIVEMTDNA